MRREGVYDDLTSNQDLLSIYPNPAQDFVVLKSKEPLTLEISNTLGKLIDIYNIEQDKELLIDLSSYSSGIYFFTLNGENTIVTKRDFEKIIDLSKSNHSF